MNIIFQQQNFEYISTPTSEEVMEKINELLQEGFYFSHLTIDGIEVYENHENYLIENLKYIKKIEVIAKTEKEFVNDVLLSVEAYIKRAMPELKLLPDGFYASPSKNTYETFNNLLEGMQWLDEMFSVVGMSNYSPTNWDKYDNLSKSLKLEIVNLGEAVENTDNVFVADIILYEIIPIFEEISNVVGNTIDTEGIRHDLS